MKFLVVLAALCALTSGQMPKRCNNPGSLIIPPSPCCNQVPNQGLAGAVGAFFDLMDLECKVNMFFDAIVNDPDMYAFFSYITGREFQELILSVQRMPEFQEFMWYFCSEADLDAYLYLNTLGDILGTPRIPHPIGPQCHPDFPFPWSTGKSQMSPRTQVEVTPYVSGVRTFMDQLQNEIPYDEINAMWYYKIENDPYLCQGYLKLQSPQFRAIALKMEFDPEFIRFVNKLEAWGIRMNQFMDDLKDFLWNRPYCR